MSSSTAKMFLCLRWLVLLSVFCLNTQMCDGQQRICGTELNKVLEQVCGGRFVRKIRKPIDLYDVYPDSGGEGDLTSPFEQLPFFSKAPASLVGKTRRRRYGVADECCKKPCALSELYPYCLPERY